MEEGISNYWMDYLNDLLISGDEYSPIWSNFHLDGAQNQIYCTLRNSNEETMNL
jgi:hypothetical protein